MAILIIICIVIFVFVDAAFDSRNSYVIVLAVVVSNVGLVAIGHLLINRKIVKD